MAKGDLACRQRSNFALRKNERGADSAGDASTEWATVGTLHWEWYQGSASWRGQLPKAACSQTGGLCTLSKTSSGHEPRDRAQGLRGERGQTRARLHQRRHQCRPPVRTDNTLRRQKQVPAFFPGPWRTRHHRAEQQGPLHRVEPCPKATGVRLVPRPQKWRWEPKSPPKLTEPPSTCCQRAPDHHYQASWLQIRPRLPTPVNTLERPQPIT